MRYVTKMLILKRANKRHFYKISLFNKDGKAVTYVGSKNIKTMLHKGYKVLKRSTKKKHYIILIKYLDLEKNLQ